MFKLVPGKYLPMLLFKICVILATFTTYRLLVYYSLNIQIVWCLAYETQEEELKIALILQKTTQRQVNLFL